VDLIHDLMAVLSSTDKTDSQKVLAMAKIANRFDFSEMRARNEPAPSHHPPTAPTTRGGPRCPECGGPLVWAESRGHCCNACGWAER